MTFPEEYGGTLGDEMSFGVVAEELAKVAGFLLYVYFPTVSFCAQAVYLFGTEEQRQRVLPLVANGTVRMAIGMTEPDAGSDVRADQGSGDPGGRRLQAPRAEGFRHRRRLGRLHPHLGSVRAGAGAGSRDFTVFLVPAKTEGVEVPLRKLAGQATHTCEALLDNVRLEESALPGGAEGVGNGMAVMLEMLDGERVYVVAQGVGMGQQALDWALEHARSRVQFGKPIIEHQAIAHMLADMSVDVEAARDMTYHVAHCSKNPKPGQPRQPWPSSSQPRRLADA